MMRENRKWPQIIRLPKQQWSMPWQHNAIVAANNTKQSTKVSESSSNEESLGEEGGEDNDGKKYGADCSVMPLYQLPHHWGAVPQGGQVSNEAVCKVLPTEKGVLVARQGEPGEEERSAGVSLRWQKKKAAEKVRNMERLVALVKETVAKVLDFQLGKMVGLLWELVGKVDRLANLSRKGKASAGPGHISKLAGGSGNTAALEDLVSEVSNWSPLHNP
ncbi:hypothetical protein EDC04DRAFT_2606438 [Pisolithus marmoratus]|nr:hypothetical protein EDC04DRAFT_2606438 [Pisolithus marmoratus]